MFLVIFRKFVFCTALSLLLFSCVADVKIGDSEENLENNNVNDENPDYRKSPDERMVIGHQYTNIHNIPAEWIVAAQANLHIVYNHTSHGSQLISGMNALEGFPAFSGQYSWDDAGREGSGIDLDDLGIPGAADLSQGDSEDANGDTPWAIGARTLLNNPANYHINVVMWSWCNIAGHNIPRYLRNMEKLIAEYGVGGTNPRSAQHPVVFVFMTGHANSGGPNDSSDSQNRLIREHVAAHNRVLFDFADIENYDPDDNYFLSLNVQDDLAYNLHGVGDANWATDYLARNPNSEEDFLVHGTEGYTPISSCAHSPEAGGNHDAKLNCILKGKAAWSLFARIAGWDGVP
ncbi:MAG: hypothetical protein A2504_05640 [Bdellovibrionales bacterium RIFOXYD12_FULL_39_22]|nr:MAG: hypothetical protein A2385_06185 [Bdellovibrionales bacterium RIFOXYB1_FULL_39_21]OFZ41867.1 MAG: hypothetical protein A2485_08155 [Bdellovibrionales bacterium RIFOXYC12_FULL_39_17]OFZ50583.1 MAG: hypothetical protein A2404_05105 [Bdellovibrionales bacterium RIFOXYC1_FULL_39_130]OFZ77806.1 MAG: hypothetical protein A2560_00275 [Bdellovibrionales bacterium RIFOXYD1_FULL_39_84]OFZ93758.1 MAG: hypothetical protein A2504_05640 [Bdellovibrionales bacterium RIFOXYD12_FULL_39_22]HLE11557.1 hy